tara:strand:+ start:3028 stop:3237 length:210 start_codon:yes stop_codon:yes gene_type:complete
MSWHRITFDTTHDKLINEKMIVGIEVYDDYIKIIFAANTKWDTLLLYNNEIPKSLKKLYRKKNNEKARN